MEAKNESKNQLSRSPDRGSFQKESYQRRLLENPNDESALKMLEYYDTWIQLDIEREQTAEFKNNNLEYDLRSSEYMCEKVRNDEVYAQNLYAAMCNNEFIKNDIWPLLKDERWSCSWRYAGGIIANMRQEGDYIDWYCSGIQNDYSDMDDEQFTNLSKEEQEKYLRSKRFVAESVIVDIIREDLLKLGWICIEDDSYGI